MNHSFSEQETSVAVELVQAKPGIVRIQTVLEASF
jgi:hypothetical protein